MINTTTKRNLFNSLHEMVQIKSNAYTKIKLNLERVRYEKFKFNISPAQKCVNIQDTNWYSVLSEPYNVYSRESVLVLLVLKNGNMAICMTASRETILINYYDVFK